MEIDPEEVMRHLDILGYTDVEPSLLNEFVKDLKKLIAYDRRHNDVGLFSPSSVQSKNCCCCRRSSDQTYSERMKTSPVMNDDWTDPDGLVADGDGLQELNKNQNCSWHSSPKVTNRHDRPRKNYSKREPNCTQPKCYFCEYISTENRPKVKVKHCPSYTVHIGATFNIEL